jgi:hypothetical protein
MFIGHYAAALAADTAEPRAPLWSYVLGCQLLDVGWSGFVMAGVEHFRFDPSLPGSPLDLYDMPLTHSLPGALAFSVAAGLAAKGLLRVPARAAAMVGAVVFSHWALDLLVHRPDLELWPGGPKAGLSGWNHPIPEATVEMAMIAIVGAMWVLKRRDRGFAAWPGVLFLVLLSLVQLIAQTMPGGGSEAAFGLSALAAYPVITAWAAFLERKPRAGRAPRAVAP